MTDLLMLQVVSNGKGRLEPLHKAAEISFSSMQKEMEMVGHKRESVQNNVVGVTHLKESIDKERVVVIIGTIR